MTTSTDSPKRRRAPAGLKARGAKFWRETLAAYELTDSELSLLVEACRTMDNLDALADVIAADGATTMGSQGQTVVHPALTEARGQRVVLHRLLSALALPDDEGEAVPSASRTQAQRAGAARWAGVVTEASRRRGKGA